MKFQDFFDVSVKYLLEELGDFPFLKDMPDVRDSFRGTFAGLTNVLDVKGGAKWLAGTPKAKQGFELLEGFNLYNPETEEVDSEALFAFLDGWVKEGVPLRIFGILKLDSDGVKSWAKRLKKAEGSENET